MTPADLLISRLGTRVVDAIVEHAPSLTGTPEEKRRVVADVLAAASEYGGVHLPKAALVLNPELTTKTFPGGVPALTTKGLAAFYERRGWRYMVLRVGPLLRSFIGQNERLQELLALYEAQCEAEGVSHVPGFADGPYVAGGTAESSAFGTMVDGADDQ